MTFDLAQPFKPFEQLMGVLPSRSRKLLPEAYRVQFHFSLSNLKDLMTEPGSTIIDFYPHDFDLDLNGKKQDWEAIVKIPFIDEKRLLDAMRSAIPNLT
jgi:5'-3' exoribonuclease 1